MQFKSIVIALLTVGATIPGTTAVKAVYNDNLKLWDIGNVPWMPNNRQTPVQDMGSCGPNIKEGKYGCGRFGPGLARTLRVIYVCTNGRLRRRETCTRGTKNDMCVRNSRRKGKAFYPFEAADQLVCVETKDALKP